MKPNAAWQGPSAVLCSGFESGFGAARSSLEGKSVRIRTGGILKGVFGRLQYRILSMSSKSTFCPRRS